MVREFVIATVLIASAVGVGIFVGHLLDPLPAKRMDRLVLEGRS